MERHFEKHSFTNKENPKEREMDDFLAKISETLKSEGVPVDVDCRIDMEQFSDVMNKAVIGEDKRKAEESYLQNYPNLSPERAREEKEERSGEKLEKLITVLFHKFLKDYFIVARASLHDDVQNGVDNIILEKDTGNLVCAFDEVASISGPDIQEKVKNIMVRNEKGCKLKYGVFMGNGKIRKGIIMGAPIFYLALPENILTEAINKMNYSLEEAGDFEKDLFENFIKLLEYQLSSLKLNKHIDPQVKQRIEYFKGTLVKFKEAKTRFDVKK